jgi:hypothetical protein
MPASPQQISNGSKISAGDMARQLGWVKVFQPNDLNHAGVVCKIFRDPNDPNYDAKLTGIKVGLTRVTSRGFSFANGIHFYCTNMAGVASIAFHRSFTGGRQASVLLGNSCVDASNPGMFAGIAHNLAPLGGANYCAAVVVHELGHNLHERANEGFFWDGAAAGAAEPTAGTVSNYATKNALEFVAEVFTGKMYGKNYSDVVMAAYAGYGGPNNPNFP